MTSARDMKNLIRKMGIETNPEANEMVLKGLLEEFDKAERQDSAASQPGIRRIIMKSMIVKLAAAAVIVVIVAVGLVLWLPGGKGEVKIPPELVNKHLTATWSQPPSRWLWINFQPAKSWPLARSMMRELG
ncbi:MAG: hypothetical protein ACYS8I_03145 [Planctomycetota bacterium]|jgi:hypothetical protein